MKENLLLLNNLSEPRRIKSTKYMTSISKHVYIDKLDDVINKQNNTYNGTIKMKSTNVKLSKYIDLCVENSDKYRIYWS